MKSVEEFLSYINDLDIKLYVEGDRLRCNAPKETLTPAIRTQLADHKAEILEFLNKANLSARSSDNYQPLPQIVPSPNERYKPFPLTDIQQAFWIGRQGDFELSNVSTHVYIEVETVDLDLERLEKAWQQLIDRHDMLRAVVRPDGQQQILQQVPAYEIKVLDLRGQNSELAASQLADVRAQLSHQVLPADQWPLFEIRAAQLDDSKVRLYISFDLLIGDAWSFQTILGQLVQLIQNPETAFPGLELSFRDYVLAEIALRNSQLYQRSKEYWLNRISSLPPSPELPLQKNPAVIAHPRFVRRSGKLDPDTWGRLKKRASVANLTPSGLLLAAFAEILTIWSKTPRFTINLTLFNRLPLHPQVNQIVGDFTSLTLLTVDNSGEDSFEVRSRRIQKQFWDDFDHRYFSGVQVLRELARIQKRHAGMFVPVVFTSTLINDSLSRDQAGAKFASISTLGEVAYMLTQTPQVYLDHQVSEQAGVLAFSWDAVEELFPAGLLDDMFAAYCHFLERLANEELWQAPTRQLLPPAQLRQVAALNATDTPVPEAALLHSLFFEQAKRQPEQIAVVTTQRTLTYQELSTRAHQLGHQLRQLGARPNQLVAIAMDKGWEQVVAASGILAAGAAYIPIDPDLPTERRWHLLKQTQVQWVITQSLLDTSLEWPENVTRLCIDTLESASACEPWEWVQQADDLAYVIYTSGSTGKPKGVAIAHRGAVNTILDINQRFDVKSEDRVFALSSLSFDLSVYDIFGTLAAGGTIVIPDGSCTKDPAHWVQLMMQQQVTIWNSVPALMQMLVEYVIGRRERLPRWLRLVLLSGDWLPVSLPDQIRALSEQVQVVSLGGATEASIWSILYPIEQVDPNWKSIPYGRPMANQCFYVLNEALEPCPVWVPGQLYIGGMGLALGYWRDEQKTNASFIIHPHTQERLYKTGDLGRYLPDGTIEFLGREDCQVKVNGYRIELGEIETALQQHPAVKEAVVTAVGESRQNKQLVTYIVPGQDSASPLFEVESTAQPQVEKLWAGVQTARSEARQLPLDTALQTFAACSQVLDRLSIFSMCRTLNDLGLFIHPQERHTLADILHSCQIQPHYSKLLSQWLKVLEEEGLLQRDGEETFVNPQPLPTDHPDELWQEFRNYATQDAQMQILLKYFQRSIENQTAMLKGEVNPLELFFPDGSWQTAESMYQLNPVSKYYNTLAQHVLQSIARAWPSSQKMRILEVGAGTGGTTAFLLPVLPPLQAVYTYTDLSQFFITQAQEKFRDYPFIQYGLLDIDQNPVHQGYEPHSFDIIVAANVLHDAYHIGKTLQYWRSLLAPSGLLIVLEATQNNPFQMISVRFIEGYSHYEDERLQTNQPLLSVTEWQQALYSNGFDQFVAIPEADSPDRVHVTHVMVVRGPSEVKRFKPSELRDYLQQKLPDYMVPANYILVDALPLTPNGKVDRRSLPQLKSLQENTKYDETYAAPQTKTEQLLAEIWAEILRVDKVGIQANFFELGGDSLLGIQVTAKANQQGIDLKPQQIFQYPTIAELASLVSSDCPSGTRTPEAARSDTSSASLVAIKPHGSQKPLFCIHSSSGSADSFIQLSRYIGSDQPVYGLQSRELDREQKTITTIEDMAAHYIEAIRTVQPTGSYHLCGWSMGGIVAYEMAQQLKSSGQDVELLALLDIMADDREKQLEALSSQIKTTELIAETLSAERASAVISVNQANVQAMLDYTLRTYSGKITLIKAIEQPSIISSDPYFGWHKYALGGVEVHEVPGNHFSMMVTPHLKVLAEKLGFCLAK